jgi:hypothetical protein
MVKRHAYQGQIKYVMPHGITGLERTTGFPETSVSNYYYSLRNNPEERESQTIDKSQF